MAEPEMLTCEQAFATHAGIDLAGCLNDRDALAAEVARIGLNVRPDDTWSDLFSRVIVTIEPKLGDSRLTFLTHYPVCEAALARPCPADPRWAERFEAYACGVELANGFGELTDAAEQRRRFVADMDEKQRLYGRRYPIDEDFIAALAHMPPASGVALGFDRLALLALGGTDIRQVIWTPFPG
jgi:lysyl-tRNA synthetase class 2